MSVTDLEKRKHKILELVIELYVSTAEPVGSQFVSRKLRSSLSPATIRHIMAELEADGLLEHPHTSAGRVPTDQGYRFYVDTMMETPSIGPEQREQIARRIQPVELDVDQLLAHACTVLSEMSQQVGFAVAPTVKQSTVKQIEIVPLGVRKILCVLVANEEMIASHVVEIAEPMSRDEAVALARFVNTELVGISFSDLLDSLERRMLTERDSLYHLVKRSLDILQHALSTEPEERFFLEGAKYVFSQPEFSRNPQQAFELLKGLDAEDLLLQRIRQDITADGVRVRIGREVQVPGLEGCSYLMAPVTLGEEVVGGIGILGPKRMDYPQMRSLVEGMGQCVTEVLAHGNAR